MQSLDGTKRCPMCAFEVTEEAAVCGKCGLSLVGQQQVSLGSFKLSAPPPESLNAVEEPPEIETTISSRHEQPPILNSPSPPPPPPPTSAPAPMSTPVPQKGFLAWLRSFFKR